MGDHHVIGITLLLASGNLSLLSHEQVTLMSSLCRWEMSFCTSDQSRFRIFRSKMIRCLLLISLLIHASLAKKQDQPTEPQAPLKKWLTLSGNINFFSQQSLVFSLFFFPSFNKYVWSPGDPPLVIARGGFSGLFPESSAYANDMANQLKFTEVALFCNLQLTKDGIGICLSDIRLDNSTNIGMIFPKDPKSYNINGQQVKGWFALDYTSDVIISNVSLVQNVLSRTNAFDRQLPVSTVEDVTGVKPTVFWLNVQYDAFYTEHKLSVSGYLEKAMRFMGINFISSPEIGFLKNINGKINRVRTKLIFEFLDPDVVEPTTKQTYSSILKDLSTIKTFASGILVPKGYIWPVDANNYLGNPTTLVADAHKLGLEVYASGFANDMPGSYSYSYDPTAEYLQFIDNPQFTVDGLLTDFSPTATNAIGELINCCSAVPYFCFNHNSYKHIKEKSHALPLMKPPSPRKGYLKKKYNVCLRFCAFTGKALIITHNGASGMYPGCTDLAYDQAVNDGADVIDCSVQMSKDGVAFCLDSADLTGDTTAMPTFVARSVSIPEVQKDKGIFSFDLTWSEIQTLKPQMVSPFGQNAGYQRNPEAKNKGKFMTLADFLEFARAKAVSGILINIEVRIFIFLPLLFLFFPFHSHNHSPIGESVELYNYVHQLCRLSFCDKILTLMPLQNAAYLASKKGLGIVDSVTKALSNATFDKQQTQQVLIQSDDTSVLSKFQIVPAYKRLLRINKEIGDTPKPTVDEIKKYADGVVVTRPSLISIENGFTKAQTNVLDQMHAANISVYIAVLRNEFVALPFDFYADPMVELATYVAALEVDGVITEFPGTASRYMRSPCVDLNGEIAIIPAEPGALVKQVPAIAQPPANPPNPPLEVKDVVDPPLPPVTNLSSSTASPGSPGAPAPSSSSGLTITTNFGLCLAAIMALHLLSLGH
ncbi:glycerophosphodiester phosphodiesterase GDPDL7-like [Durio zibethinus]|uniref:glycerophosphodiester phosphodiesterase n=1 Tax=Durio zibethinus TaxID=66656 RepID=A0A6P5XKW6_DURZI|nr:glycerophosphodiester phosphodiesterase GDPDL7-like [Durio zibethinus]